MKNCYILLVLLGALTFNCSESEAANKGALIPLYQSAINSATGVELIVTNTGDGSGTVTSNPAGIACGNDCSKRFPRNSEVTLTATWDTGSFTGWSGACSGNEPTCTVVMGDAKNVTATFAQKTLVRETGIWWGLHNGNRPTFYYTHLMRDYPPTFKLVLENCAEATVINDGHRYTSDKLIAKQSDVGGRGMAVTTQSGVCLGSFYNKSYIEYYKEDMPRENPPVLIP